MAFRWVEKNESGSLNGCHLREGEWFVRDLDSSGRGGKVGRDGSRDVCAMQECDCSLLSFDKNGGDEEFEDDDKHTETNRMEDRHSGRR